MLKHEHDKRAEPKQDNFYYLSYSIWLFAAVAFGSTSIPEQVQGNSERVLIAAFAISAGLLLLKIFKSRYSIRQILLVCLLLPLFIVSWHRSGVYSLLIVLLFIFAAKGISLRHVARSTLLVLPMAFLFVQLMVWLGFATNYTLERAGSLTVRQSLGFMHPNTLGILCVNFCMAWIYYNWDRKGLRYTFVPLGIMAFVGFVLDARGSLLILAAVLVFWLFGRMRSAPEEHKRRRWPLVALATCVLVPFAAVRWYDPRHPASTGLDSVLSSRLSLANSYWDYYGLTVLGQEVQIGTVDDFSFLGYLDGTRGTVDSGFLYLALTAGLLPLLLLAAGMLLALKHALVIRDRPLVLCIFAWAFLGWFETAVASVQYSFAIVAIGVAMFSEEKQPPSPKSRLEAPLINAGVSGSISSGR